MNFRLTLELLLRRHGWPLALGVSLLVSICIVALVHLVPKGMGPAVVQPSDGSRQHDMHRRAFRAVLISPDELEAQQRAVVEAAVNYGLELGRIDYGFENNEAGRFGKATLQMPLRGNYTDFRSFLAAALAAHPALAIEDLAIQRNPDGNGVGARLKLAFLTASDAGPGR
ncbi:MAG: hypothetical protein KKF85_04270 [Gammaproteobacteria bacterium]|nr:hypothetical protein [Rhodocyclaceae bacterium]MBU3910328.1 hypothetical protein [Gammaproteobacteria bacterium]MBU3990258.1 hypothetical protein [Gammaproteobacteria bacterium]MBU4004155.1 hypothetical protein [Gammaproteobacteria bacterium]MBU4020402.1 hypothetical protein [Gammaproteobacteria bacterium]